IGFEWTNHYKLFPWLGLDVDVAYTRARFTDFDPAGDNIPGAPGLIASAGLVLGEKTGWVGALKMRYFGRRLLTEDGTIESSPTPLVNARVGYNSDNGVRLQLDVLNLLDPQANQIEYHYVSRLPGEPLEGVADRHLHPVEPLAMRATLAGKI